MTAGIGGKTSEDPGSGSTAAATGPTLARGVSSAGDPGADFVKNLHQPFAFTPPAAAATREEKTVPPLHCGSAMAMSPGPDASLPWAQFHSGLGEWVCPCGFRQDAAPAADPLAAVRAASGRLESLEWEMDAAQAALATAVRAAAAAGAESPGLGVAAGLSAEALQDILR